MKPNNKIAAVAVAVTLGMGGAVAIDQTQAVVPLDCVLQEAPIQNIDKVMKEYRIDEGFIVTREMNATDRATIKGCEIAKTIEKVKVTKGAYEIEIVDIEPIDGGVQIFARAWKDGEQIGFGVDGTVDIERFRIFNPPVLVLDEEGSIRQEWSDDLTKEQHSRTLREDTVEATLQSLQHTVSVMKNTHDSAKIIRGKRGNTTSTFYPAAGDTTAYDGLVRIQGANVAYSTLNNQITSTQAFPAETATPGIRDIASTVSNQFASIGRGVFGFVTSAIPDTDDISSATLSFYGSSKLTNLGDTVFEVVEHTPSNESSLTGTEYNYSRLGTTKLATGINTASFSTAGYNDFSLNASGLAVIDKTGNTFFATISEWQFNDAFSGTWASGANTQVVVFHADQTGTSNDPKLVVEHAAPSDRRIINIQ